MGDFSQNNWCKINRTETSKRSMCIMSDSQYYDISTIRFKFYSGIRDVSIGRAGHGSIERWFTWVIGHER